MFSRNKIAALVAEFLGTGVLALVIISVQRSTIGVPYFVGIAAGLAAGMLYLVFAKASGGQLNPALTIGLWTARKIKTLDALLYVVVQLLGAYLAGLLYAYFIDNELTAVSDVFTGRVLVAETVGAIIFTMAVAAALSVRGRSEGTKASMVGAGLTLGIIAASAASVGIVNPAVALATNAWVWGTYVLGPVLGGVIGVNLYSLLFATSDNKVAAGATTASASSVTAKPAAKKAPAKKPAAKKKPTAKRTTAKKK